jgi:putative intracellular protease/amidase
MLTAAPFPRAPRNRWDTATTVTLALCAAAAAVMAAGALLGRRDIAVPAIAVTFLLAVATLAAAGQADLARARRIAEAETAGHTTQARS